MNKWQAIQYFWESFGLPAYDENTVPDEATMPYITYSAPTSSLDEAVLLTASLWYRTNSWSDISVKADEISDSLIQVNTIPLDIGYLYLTRGQPFAQRMSDEDGTIRRIYLNVMAEFLTP